MPAGGGAGAEQSRGRAELCGQGLGNFTNPAQTPMQKSWEHQPLQGTARAGKAGHQDVQPNATETAKNMVFPSIISA